MTLPSAEELYQQLKQGVAQLLLQYPLDKVHLVGIYSGGALLAKRLQRDLALPNPMGLLNTSFYRDDFYKIGLHSQTKPTHIPFDVHDKHIVVIDDILFTGRTVRATMNELFDYGRPASIALAVLIDRAGRQLPVAPTVAALHMPLPEGHHFVLKQQNDLFDIVIQKD